MNTKITDDHRNRGAIVYIRQSTPGQLTANHESQRRQYGLANRARELGFREVETIDQDLGRSGSGKVDRPGFQKLVATVCSGTVGAVFAIEASRLARNGREWHHLIELCALSGVLVIDFDGVYNPRELNDMLLLGVKGTLSAFELALLRQRSQEAIRSKAARGELRFCLPIGFCWTRDGRIEMDPDRRIQEGIRLVFQRFESLRSVRQCTCGSGQKKCRCHRLALAGLEMLLSGNYQSTIRYMAYSQIPRMPVRMRSAKQKIERVSWMGKRKQLVAISSPVRNGRHFFAIITQVTLLGNSLSSINRY